MASSSTTTAAANNNRRSFSLSIRKPFADVSNRIRPQSQSSTNSKQQSKPQISKPTVLNKRKSTASESLGWPFNLASSSSPPRPTSSPSSSPSPPRLSTQPFSALVRSPSSKLFASLRRKPVPPVVVETCPTPKKDSLDIDRRRTLLSESPPVRLQFGSGGEDEVDEEEPEGSGERRRISFEEVLVRGMFGEERRRGGFQDETFDTEEGDESRRFTSDEVDGEGEGYSYYSPASSTPSFDRKGPLSHHEQGSSSSNNRLSLSTDYNLSPPPPPPVFNATVVDSDEEEYFPSKYDTIRRALARDPLPQLRSRSRSPSPSPLPRSPAVRESLTSSSYFPEASTSTSDAIASSSTKPPRPPRPRHSAPPPSLPLTSSDEELPLFPPSSFYAPKHITDSSVYDRRYSLPLPLPPSDPRKLSETFYPVHRTNLRKFDRPLPPTTTTLLAHTEEPQMLSTGDKERYSSIKSLCTYDLEHLPRPGGVKERPYKVGWKELMKPSGFVKSGKGSGKVGDLWGAVEVVEEKKEEDRRSVRRSVVGSIRKSLGRRSKIEGEGEDKEQLEDWVAVVVC